MGKVTVHFRKDLEERVRDLSRRTGIPLSQLIAEAVEKYFQTIQREKAFEKLKAHVGSLQHINTEEILEDLERARNDRRI